MKRFFGGLILLIILLPSFASSKPLTWESHLKEAKQLVSDGKFEQAKNYLSEQSRRKDLNDADRVVIALFAVEYTISYGDKKQALFIIKPVYDDLVQKYGAKGFLVSFARSLLIQTYIRREEYNKALGLAKLEVQLASTKKGLAEAYLSLADVYRGRKEFTLSIKNYLKGEQIFKQLNDKDKYNSNLDVLYNNLAFTYEKKGDYKNALINYHASLRLRDKNQKSYYRTLFNMTGIYRSLGRADKAKHHLIEISDYYLKSEGENSLDYIRIENELGVLEDDYGHYNEALSHYKKVLSYGERLGREELKALALKNMGGAYNSLGKGMLAASSLEKALEIYQKLPPSVQLADTYESLALSASEKNSFQKELSFYDKALAIRNALHQQNEPDYGHLLTNKAMAYQKNQDYQQAEALYEKAFSILKKAEPKGEKTGALLINWATLWLKQKDYARAEHMLLEGIEILKQTVGETHPKLAYAYNNLAMVYSVTDQRTKSVDYYQKAVEISKATRGPDHPTTKLYYRNLILEKIERRVSRRHG